MRFFTNLSATIIIISGLVFSAINSFAQTLPMPVLVEAPCYGGIGLTAPIEVDPVPGADGYIWDAQPSTSLLVDGLSSPVTTMLPSATLTFTQNAPVWKVCVSAFNTCCTSPWNCIFIYNSVPIVFLPSNYTALPPGITTDFGIYYLCLPLLGQHTIHWYVTGNITFSNGTQSITSGQDTTVVPLTFGPNFTGGTLCAYTVNQIGLSSDTICMNISALTSLDESAQTISDVFFDSGSNEFVINLSNFPKGSLEFNLYDINGRKLISQTVTPSGKQVRIHSSNTLANGVYFAETGSGGDYSRTKLFIRQ
jgi:hypothetical protein